MYNLIIKEEFCVKMSEFAVFCKKHSRILICVLIGAYFAVTIPLMRHFGITCVFKHFLGIPCPGCGMTRAIISVLRLDFGAALYYNPLVFALPYVAAYIIFNFKGKAHNYILLAIGILFFVNWLIRLVGPAWLAV